MGKNNKIRRVQKRLKKLKRQKDLRKKKLISDNKRLGPVLYKVQSPFAKINNEDREKLIHEIAKNSEKEFEDSLSNIKKILCQYDPISIISILSLYDLSVGINDKGMSKDDSQFEIHQAHIEILQGLTLQINQNELGRQAPDPHTIQELRTTLINFTNAYHYRDLAEVIESQLNEDEKAVLLIQKHIRSYTLMVRNWGYFSQVKSITQDIYEYFDPLLEKKCDFTFTNIINLFELMLNETEINLTNRYKVLSNLYKLKDKNKLISEYFELIGEQSEDVEHFKQKIDVNSTSFESLFAMLLSHYDLFINEIYQFSSRFLSNKAGIDEDVVIKILDKFSYKFGELVSYQTDYLYLSNPVWFRPIIKLEDGKYFCAFPQLFFSFIIPSLDKIIEEIDNKLLSIRKADYLEEKIVKIINNKFPESNTVSGVKWKYNGIEYETDLITFIDTYAVIVEAKSGKITEPALRGAPARLKKHIEEILIAPNIQSKRLKQKLQELIAEPEIIDGLRDKLPIDLNTIHKIIRVSVSLESFGAIQANITQLRETGWLPDNFEPCPTMNLADFETLFDLLDHPVQILHYLERRTELENSLEYMGDELDLMGLYVQTLFDVGGIDAHFDISRMSSILDNYYNSKDTGVLIPKPKPKISPLFSEIMEQIEKRNIHRWTEIGVILNNFSPEDQRRLTKMINIYKQKVQKNWMIDGHKNTVICSSKFSKYALCYVMYKNNNVNKKKEFIQMAAEYGFESSHIKKCLVIAKNLDRNEPYHFIGLWER